MIIPEPTLAKRGSVTPEETRRRIEDTAEALFRRIGYQKTAVADIARELGMSPANVYRFYASKSAINEAIATRMLSGLAEEIWTIARADGPAEARLPALLRTLHRRHMALFFTERRLHDMVSAAMAEHWDCIQRFVTAVQGAIRHVVMDGMAAGHFRRGDPDRLALSVKQACLAFVHPVIIAECVGRGMPEAQLEAELDEVIELVLRGLRA